MTVNPAVKVGAIILAALVIFISVVWFLRGYGLRRSVYHVTVTFDDSMGLSEGSAVRMAGVTVGEVKGINLDEKQRAVVDLQINKACRIPKGSRFTLQVGLLVGDKFVSIVPNRKTNKFVSDGTAVGGEQPPRLEDLLPKAEALMANLMEASNTLKGVLGNKEYQQKIGSILARLDTATATLNQALGELNKAGSTVNRTLTVVESATVEERENIHIVVQNVMAASQSLNDLIAELRRVAEDQDLQANLRGTMESARKAVESLERSTESMEKLVTAPEFQEDIRQAAAGAHQAVDEAQKVLGRFDKILPDRKINLGTRLPAPQTRQTALNVLVQPSGNETRATLSTSFSTGKDKFVKIGFFDVGSSNKLILQPGVAIDQNMDWRYGIYASKLGMGIDRKISSRWFTSVDLYDPEDFQLDLLTGYTMTDSWGLLLGVDDLFKDNKLSVGARFTR